MLSLQNHLYTYASEEGSGFGGTDKCFRFRYTFHIIKFHCHGNLMSHQNLKEKFAAKVNVFSVSKIGFVDVLIPLPAR